MCLTLFHKEDVIKFMYSLTKNVNFNRHEMCMFISFLLCFSPTTMQVPHMLQSGVEYMFNHNADLLCEAADLIDSHTNLAEGVENMMKHVVGNSGSSDGCSIVLLALAKTLVVKGHHPDKVNEAVSLYISKQSYTRFTGERTRQFLIFTAKEILRHLNTFL
jgi:hypothetical protein